MNQEPIPVLDYGFLQLDEWMGSDLKVVRMARQSYNAQWRTGKDENSDFKLIHSLMRDYHTGPFEHCTMTFNVKAPLFVFRQWHRHRTQSYSEVSARYTQLPDEMYIPNIDHIGIQDKVNKQARYMKDLNPEERAHLEQSLYEYETHIHRAYELYQRLLTVYHWPRELARSVLPLSIYSTMSTTMNLHNCFHFLKLRVDNHSQFEIRQYANVMHDLLKPIFPVCVEAWEKFRLGISSPPR